MGLRITATFFLEVVGNQESKVERLFKIESGIAKRLVSQLELILTQFHATPEALGDAKTFVVQFPREFDAYPSQS